jgi:hypothetical protein
MRPSTIFPLILCLGCAAQMVNPPGSTNSSIYAPVNEASRGGVVRYLNDGAGFVKKKRRESAYKQMHDACGGAYRIDAEGAQVRDGVVMAIDPDMAVALASEYWYIQFSCVR